MFLILSLIVGVACSLITIRTLTSYTEMRAVWKGVIAVLTAVGWFAPFIIAIVRRYGWLSGGAYVMFTQIAYFLFGLGFILFCLLIFRDAQWFAGYHLARWAGRPVEGFDPMNPVLLKKANIAVCVLSFLVVFYALYEGVKLPAVRRVNIDTPKVERPVKIAVLSDLHINAATSPARVRKIVERVNALEPDIIVLPGDIIDDGPKALEKQMDALVKLKAKDGVFVTLGNHEFYVGPMLWEKEFRRRGFYYLANHARMLDGSNVYVAGIPDPRMLQMDDMMRESIDATLDQRAPGAYTVFLSHSPDFIKQLDAGKVDLQISGHTHGGQIFPFHLIVKRANGFLAGLYDVRGMKLYVSRGAGGWGPPMRLFAPSEITLITLEPNK